MSPAQVAQKVGKSVEDEYSYNGDYKTLYQRYSDLSDISYWYEDSYCLNKFKLSNIYFSYEDIEQPLSKAEVGLGKPDLVENDSYITEENGKKTKVKTVSKSYKHLIISAEYINNKWMVSDIQYVN